MAPAPQPREARWLAAAPEGSHPPRLCSPGERLEPCKRPSRAMGHRHELNFRSGQIFTAAFALADLERSTRSALDGTDLFFFCLDSACAAAAFFAASFATSLAAWLTATAAASSAAFLALLRNVFGTGNVLNLVWIHLDSSWS